jgi:hypothetical protein
VQKLRAQNGVALRTPQTLQVKAPGQDEVTFESYDDTNYGYLRLVVDPQQLRIEYHPASDTVDVKTPDDSVTVDLRSHKRTLYRPNNLGYPDMVQAVRNQRDAQAQQAKIVTKRRRR